MGIVQQVVRTMPPQTRHYSRGGSCLALPLAPQHRARHVSSRPLVSGNELKVNVMSVKALPPLPAFVRHDIQYAGQTYYKAYDWATHPWDEREREAFESIFDEELKTTLDSYGGTRRDGDYVYPTQKAPPTTADGERESLETRLWSSFCAADTSGDGKLSRKEFFAALDAQGALDGRAREWSEKLRNIDANDNATIEWDEFLELGRTNPEIVDIMREVEWSGTRRSSIFAKGPSASGRVGERAELQ